MPILDHRDFLKILGVGIAAGAFPTIMNNKTFASQKMSQGFYDVPMKGTVRILHITDVHGQLKPVNFREPNVNLGVDYSIDPVKSLGSQITNIVLDDGRKLDPDKTYTVSGWATVNRTPEGRLMWKVKTVCAHACQLKC